MATSRWVIASATGGLMILVTAWPVHAQGAAGRSEPAARPVASLASFPPGSIQGTVLDEKGEPVPGAVISALGGSTLVAVTDRSGRFEIRGLPPGPYLVRAHLAGFVTPPARIVQVRSSVRVASPIALRHVGSTAPAVLDAGFGGATQAAQSAPAPADANQPATSDTGNADKGDDGETAWRIRHVRRSILKDVTLPADVIAGNSEPAVRADRADFFERTPFSGQVDFLTSSSFDGPQQLFTPANLPAGAANLSVTAPIGSNADWSVRGAFTQADMSAWMVSGAYQTRAVDRQQYNAGFSYSAQRFNVGNPLVASTATASRSASEIFAFDTFTVSPQLAVTYGARYARYDYLDTGGLASPRLEVAMSPASHLRVSALIAETAEAPGAEEFLPSSDVGIWLPPQRLFSALDPDTGLRAERTTHEALQIERDLGNATISVRSFHQHGENQMVTLFGADVPNQPISPIGHYFVGDAGNTVASGCAAAVRAAVTSWLRGSIEYSMTAAELAPTTDTRYLLLTAPSAVGPRAEHIHNVSTTIEAKVPDTATRVLILYRVGNGYAHPPNGDTGSSTDSRFDVQVHQSLPFMNFTSAKWEMLVGVRNFFREPGPDGQSVYDELLVIRPPKRIVGGLTMQF